MKVVRNGMGRCTRKGFGVMVANRNFVPKLNISEKKDPCSLLQELLFVVCMRVLSYFELQWEVS